VALQGTLETFALPDVLRLLASTHKTGRLRLTGGTGSGALWLDGGEIVAGEASGAPLAHGATDVLFELLRFKEGEFAFEDDQTAADPGEPAGVEDALGAAEAMLEEWKSIEAVVPSLDGWVSLRAELPGDEITIDADRWRQLVALGGGTTVRHLGEELGLGELPVSRTVKELVELGLVDVGEAPAAATPVPSHALDEAASIEAEPVAPVHEPPVLTVVGDAPAEPAGGSGGGSGGGVGGEHDVFDPNGLVIEEPTYSSLEGTTSSFEAAPAGEGGGGGGGGGEDDLADAAEIARQLANLSPKAAKAVAAAAKATTTEEREAALAEVDDTEDPINRGLLLKFLGSVNS
jgi:hypothetical protein